MSTPIHNQKLITIHKQRLYALEEKLATFGLNAPVEITTEIEQIKAAITALETVADLVQTVGTTTPPVIEDRRNAQNVEMRLNIMTATVMASVAAFSDLKVFVRDELHAHDRKFNRVILAGIGIMIILFTVLVLK